MTDDRGQMTEDRRQRTDVRGQMSADRCQPDLMSTAPMMTVVIFILSMMCAQPAWSAQTINRTSNDADQCEPTCSELGLPSNLLAQNDKSDSTDRSQTDSEGESTSTTEDKKKADPKKSKSLKPFTPSEKIPGEQAVDFPVDI